MLFITQNLNGELSGLVLAYDHVPAQLQCPSFFLVRGKMPQEKKKKKPTLPLLYQGQLLCEALDLSNQTKLSVLTSNSHPPDFSLALKGALIFPLTTQRYDQRHAYYFIDCDL